MTEDFLERSPDEFNYKRDLSEINAAIASHVICRYIYSDDSFKYNSDLIDGMEHIKPILDIAKKHNPDFFSNHTYPIVYRGLAELDKYIVKLDKPNYIFKPFKSSDGSYYMLSNTTVNYTAHNQVQSWTSRIDNANIFAFDQGDGGLLLITRPTVNFYFNPDKKLVPDINEHEIACIGQNKFKCIVLISKDDIKNFKKVTIKENDKIDKTSILKLVSKK